MNEMSILSRYADEMTAVQYITDPAIARDEEIRDLILVLLISTSFISKLKIKIQNILQKDNRQKRLLSMNYLLYPTK